MMNNNDYKNSLSSMLLDASWLGNLIIVRRLLEGGADINTKSKNGLTHLHLAAYRGHLGVVKALIEAGADINSRNKGEWTPLHCAANMNMDYVEIVRALMLPGADMNLKDKLGHTVMYVASHGCHIAICNLLCDVGGQPEREG